MNSARQYAAVKRARERKIGQGKIMGNVKRRVMPTQQPSRPPSTALPPTPTWESIETRRAMERINNKRICLINGPSTLEDIMFCEPIARLYHQDGYKVLWPVNKAVCSFNKHFPRITFINQEMMSVPDHKDFYNTEDMLVVPLKWAAEIMRDVNVKKSQYALFNLSLDTWKQAEWVRDEQAETELFYDILQLDGEQYNLLNGVDITPDNNLRNVRVENISDFTFLDWRLVIQNASYVFTSNGPMNLVLERMETPPKTTYIPTHRSAVHEWAETTVGDTSFNKVKKIMFVHASRGRPQKGIDAAMLMVKSMRSNVPFTYYFSLDADDPAIEEYKNKIAALDFATKTIVGNNRGCVEATNRAAACLGDEDLIIVVADDMVVKTEGWDVHILNFINNNIDADEYLVHLPNETENSKTTAIYQLLSRALYKKLGYVFNPQYISMYADNDLWATCTQLGVRCDYTTPPNPGLFIHDHPPFGVEWDETYKRTNRPECFTIGKKVYEEREQLKFPI